MLTRLSIYNQALAAVGGQSELTDIHQDAREAQLCNIWYERARNSAFGMAYWGSLKATARLPLVAERGEEWTSAMPNPRWAFAYGLPTGFLRPRFLEGFGQFELAPINSVRLLQTNVEHAILTYTQVVDDPSHWENELVDLVVAMLAWRIAYGLTRNTEVVQMAFQAAQQQYMVSVSAAANMDQDFSLDYIPDFIAARGGSILVGQSFVYPTEPFINAPPIISQI